jgi:apolipoprotein N-acyltransferase
MYPFRAVEHRVAIVRAANTGVSALIAPSGEITDALPLFVRGTLHGRIALRDRETLYTRFGDWLAYLALAVSGIVLAATRPWARIEAPSERAEGPSERAEGPSERAEGPSERTGESR